MITEDLYKDCFTKLGLLKSNSDKPWEFTDDPKFKFNYVKDSAKAYWESALNIYKHIRTLPHILDNYQELDLDLFGWMPTCLERALKEVDDKTKWSKSWKKEFDEGDREALFSHPVPALQQDMFSKTNKTLFKRRLSLAFINYVGKDAHNVIYENISCGLNMDKVMESKSLRQEYYWNRTVLNLDRDKKLQNSNFWRTMWDSTFGAIKNKALSFKSDFAPFDKDIWNDKVDGQILFSDQENSTLNFKGEGLHEENSSNIGTLDHLKKELMAIK